MFCLLRKQSNILCANLGLDIPTPRSTAATSALPQASSHMDLADLYGSAAHLHGWGNNIHSVSLPPHLPLQDVAEIILEKWPFNS